MREECPHDLFGSKDAVRKKFGSLVKWGPLWTEKYIITFKCTEPAPPCDCIEWCSSLHTCPIDGVLDIVTLEGLNVWAECGGSMGVIIHLLHVCLVPLLESNCTPSVRLSWVIIISFYLISVHHAAVSTLVRHDTISFHSAITMRYASLIQFCGCQILL